MATIHNSPQIAGFFMPKIPHLYPSALLPRAHRQPAGGMSVERIQVNQRMELTMKQQTNRIRMADQIFDASLLSGNFLGGFNSRVHGVERNATADGPARFERGQGWDKADELVRAGQIYFIHPFPHGQCKQTGFVYGGTWACNTCRTDGFQKPWWAIRVMKDGSEWCVVGEGFEDLQSSANYAFGDTREEALKAYADLMTQSAAA